MRHSQNFELFQSDKSVQNIVPKVGKVQKVVLFCEKLHIPDLPS